MLSSNCYHFPKFNTNLNIHIKPVKKVLTFSPGPAFIWRFLGLFQSHLALLALEYPWKVLDSVSIATGGHSGQEPYSRWCGWWPLGQGKCQGYFTFMVKMAISQMLKNIFPGHWNLELQVHAFIAFFTRILWTASEVFFVLWQP